MIPRNYSCVQEKKKWLSPAAFQKKQKKNSFLVAVRIVWPGAGETAHWLRLLLWFLQRTCTHRRAQNGLEL